MQQRVLIRARGLASFRRALAELAVVGKPLDARRRAVIVPTRASGELLRETIEGATIAAGRPALVLPDLVTRDEWIGVLRDALPQAPVLLSRVEREVMLERAARETARRHPHASAPFDLRPGLVATMLDFYDELKRRQRSVRRFARVLFRELGGLRGQDRGSESLIRQTTFFGFAFLAYERAMRRSGAADEHAVRDRLLAEQPALPFDHLVVAVADHPSDPRGLWPADFDLIGRLSSLARIDIVVTDEAHDAGFRERLEQELPGIAEARAAGEPRAPRLVRPAGVAETAAPVSIWRDREEEVRAAARAIRARADAAGGVLADRTAIVFQRPLPYLYLAQQVLIDARVPYQAFDALPLAAEPYAALLDLVLDVARTGGTRESTIALLRSTLIAIDVDGRPIDGRDAAALDAVLGERRATGDASTYTAEVDACVRARRLPRGIDAARAGRAARAAAAMAGAVAPFRTGATASARVAAIAAFLRAHERVPREHDAWGDRHLRARAAVLAVLDDVTGAFARHDDEPRDPDALTSILHHALEARTFAPRRGDAGVQLVDAVAARFADFDRVHIVGLVETDWPERPRRNMFYTPGLLKALGWPQQVEQTRAEQAAFRDLIGLPRETTSVSAFLLEGDSIVGLSPMAEMLRGLPTTDDRGAAAEVVFGDEAIAAGMTPDGLGDEAAAWLAARISRPALTDAAYGGFVDPQVPAPYRVSKVDRYVECPFKYFSETVLQLREERDEMAGLTPLERGTLLHTLFERFYREWQEAGGTGITAATLPDALALFSRIAESEFDGLPEADRALERARLLGSIVGSGVAERVFEAEADAGMDVRRRLLEQELNGSFSFPAGMGFEQRQIDIKGKTDRIDVLADGSLRVVDYKLGRMPDLKTSIQIAVYAHCAQQALEAADGAPHPISAASYLAFGDEQKLEGALERRGAVQAAVHARAAEFAATVARIEAGVFPPAPKHPNQCQWCGFSGVCRKEYHVEEEADEAADAV